ncbi:uncharacterized protein LOC121383998 [Gigantopelta aegis]|uniref:uncharacterized protein LOC121383998 n=1 Tax=Gigantopelta aegis TaxID=1735272 RepID=UPI001B88DFF0|nr:uncharacterized protein LOC121383998 [Gigantopelta aegis]
MPSPRNVNTSLPVILDKPSRNEVGKYPHSKHGHLRDKKTSTIFDSDMPQLRHIFQTDVSTIKAGLLPEAPLRRDEEIVKVARPRTCMPDITTDCGLTSSNKLANSAHTDRTLPEAVSVKCLPEPTATQDNVDSPWREKSHAASPVRTRRGRRCNYSKSDLEKLAYGVTSLKTNDDYVTLDSRWEHTREISPRRSRTHNKPDLEKPTHGVATQQNKDNELDLDSPRREQTREISPARARRSRTHSKSDLEKLAHGMTMQQTNENDVIVTRRSAQFTERNNSERKRKSGTSKTKGYPRLTREVLSSNFITPVSRYSRIFNWLADCNEKCVTATVPGHLPDISLTSKQKHSAL